MSQYVLWDRNQKLVLGVYPSSTDANNAMRDLISKSEGKHGPSRVLEVLTGSDPDWPSSKSKNDR